VVHEYLDVFPDDLSGMPLEFKIEIQSGTASIYKRPYQRRMSWQKSRSTCKSSSIRGISDPVVHHGLPRSLCVEEGQDTAHVCRLLTTQCSDCQEQVFAALH
jgi:hypothetical protein